MSQPVNYITSLNRRKPIKDTTHIKIVCKFEKLIVLVSKELYIFFNCEAVTGYFLVAE